MDETCNATIAEEATGTEQALLAEQPVATGGARIAARHVVGLAGVLAFAGVLTVAAFGVPGGYAQEGVQNAEQDFVGLGAPSYIALQSCYSFTGGTCSVQDCEESRGATCMSGKCNCLAGCAGADNACHKGGQNSPIKLDFKLFNKKWPTYRLYFQSTSAFGQMKTSDSFGFTFASKDLFNLYKLPSSEGDDPRFFLGSGKWPNTVARITYSASISGHGLYEAELNDAYSPDEISLAVCYSSSKHAIKIGSNSAEDWAMSKHGTWLVYAEGNPGDEGYWTPDPALTQDQINHLPACT